MLLSKKYAEVGPICIHEFPSTKNRNAPLRENISLVVEETLARALAFEKYVVNFSRYVTTFIMSILQKDIHILPLGSYHEYFSSRC